MIVIDSRQSFFDSSGAPLALGRLLFYDASSPTQLATVYADPTFAIPLGGELRLESSGWLEYAVYADRSLIVHVQQLTGTDAFDSPVFADVKTFPVLVAQETSINTSLPTVDTIDALRAIAPSDGLCVAVLGYHVRGDMEPVIAMFSSSSLEPENLGTVFESSHTGTGRWLVNSQSTEVNSRSFGVRDGAVANANFSALLSYASTKGKTVYFPKGTYALAGRVSSVASCRVRADAGVKITSTAGAYSLTLTGDNISIVDTFAGPGVSLSFTDAHVSPIPITAFDSSQSDLSGSTGKLSLYINSSRSVTLPYGSSLGTISIDEGCVLTVVNDGSTHTYFDNVIGLGKIKITSNTWMLQGNELRMSNVHAGDEGSGAYGAGFARVLLRFTGRVVCDIAISNAYSEWIESAYASSYTIPSQAAEVCFLKPTHISHVFEFKQIESVPGAIDAYMRLSQPINAHWFADAGDAVKTYAVSPLVLELDMDGINASRTVLNKRTSDGSASAPVRLRNGTINRITATGSTVHIENVTIVNSETIDTRYSVEANSLDAKSCTFYRNARKVHFPRLYSCRLDGCGFGTVGDGLSTYLNVYGGYFVSRCFKVGTYGLKVSCIPIGGVLANGEITFNEFHHINFDASQGDTVNSYATDFIVSGNRITSTSDILATNYSVNNWSTGHEMPGFIVRDNLNTVTMSPCKSTEGQARLLITKTAVNVYTSSAAPILVLNSTAPLYGFNFTPVDLYWDGFVKVVNTSVLSGKTFQLVVLPSFDYPKTAYGIFYWRVYR